MNSHAEKTQENKSQPVANIVSRKQSGYASTFHLSTIVQKLLHKENYRTWRTIVHKLNKRLN